MTVLIVIPIEKFSGQFSEILNLRSCLEGGGSCGNVMSDLLNFLNSRRCKEDFWPFLSFFIY